MRVMTLLIAYVGFALGAGLVSAPALHAQTGLVDSTATDLTPSDRNFLEESLLNARHLTAVALLGTQRADDSEVKAYATQVAHDSQELANQLSTLLGAGTAAAAAQISRPMPLMSQLEPIAFDPVFIEHVNHVNTRVVARFESASSDPDISDAVQSMVGEVLPQLRTQSETGSELIESIDF
jgi:predicted outer membrane protein